MNERSSPILYDFRFLKQSRPKTYSMVERYHSCCFLYVKDGYLTLFSSRIAGLYVTCPTCGHSEVAENWANLHHFAIDPVLLRSNCIPSSSQAQDILKSIAHGKSLLQSLEIEIQRVREVLADLEQRHENIKNHVTCQESLLSPIRRVPPEILGQIFLALRDLSGPICFGDEALENVELWTLLRVCRFWRDVVLSYSELWSQFNIVHQPFSRPSERDADMMLHQTLQLTSDCISHSRNRPLRFVFHANGGFLEAGKLLAVESPRWSSVAFNNLPVLQTLEPEIYGRLPNLRSLDLDGLGKEWESQSRPLQAFSRAPSLTRLSINEFDRPQDHFILPWHQVTRFTSFGLRRFLPILHLMPSLIEYTSIEDICQPDEIQERILLPNLERLEVTSNSPTTSQMFDALKTPKLSSLHLFSKRGFSRIYAAAVAQMIQWSECIVKRLSVTDYAVDSIFRILGEVRSLEELVITNVMYPSELLDGMEGMLPNLRTLVLWKCEPDVQLGRYLLQMVLSRAQAREDGRQSLARISVGLSTTPDSSFLQSWKDSTQQLENMSIQVELLGLFGFVYPSNYLQ